MMRALGIGGMIVGFVVASAMTAGAHTPCCERYNPCEDGHYAKAADDGDPSKSQCCHEEEVEDEDGHHHVEVCEEAPYAGYRCDSDPAANATAIPGRQAVAGCVSVEHDACVAGAITPSGAEGCVWFSGAGLGSQGVSGGEPNGDWDDCVEHSVKNCCDAGACELVEGGGGGH